MQPTLVPLGTLTFTMSETLAIPNTPVGTRVIVEFSNARWTGERLNAEQKGAHAADWLTVSADSVATLDIRLCLQTASGSLLYIHGPGKTDARRFAQQGGPMYFFPAVETGDPQLAWLNRLPIVACGMASGKNATFELYEVQ